MTHPILDPSFWDKRTKEAKKPHEAIFNCNEELWKAIEVKHRSILAKTIQPSDSVLDVGCAWGRLLTMMPEEWYGDYVGIDLTPSFLMKAREKYPFRRFIQCEVLTVSNLLVQKFDWAVMVSFRPMIRNNLGGEYWERVKTALEGVSDKRLYLEYDLQDEGSVE